ncbi:copper resistance CopC/CopD family protein [Mycobacterium sp. C31M]
MRRFTLRILAAAIMAAPLPAAVWAAAPAFAHATLISTTPADGTPLDASPAALTFELSEPVSLVDGSTQLIDADGTRYPLSAPHLDDGRTRIVVVPAEPLPAGAYLVTTRVVSADTHVVSLSIRFTVGAVTEQGQWAQQSGQSAVGRAVVLPVKITVYLGTVLSAGVLLAGRWVWPGILGSRRFRILYRVGTGLLAAGLLGRLLILVVEQAGGLAAASWSAVTTIVGTPFGTALTIATALAVPTVLAPPGRHRGTTVLALVYAGAAVAAVALGGHGGSTDLWPLPLLLTAGHVYAVAVWLGGMTVLALLAPEPVALARWHRVALGHVGLLVVAGIGLALLQVRPWAALLTTSYGLTLTLKVIAVAAAITVGYLAFRKAHKGIGHRPAVLVEAGLAILVIGLTSALSSLTPAKDSYTTDVSTTVDFGMGDVLDVHIDTVRRGSQAVTVGYHGSDAAELDIELSSVAANVARLPVEMTPVGDGRWRSDGLIVPAAGQWKVTVRFDDGGGPKLASFFYEVL